MTRRVVEKLCTKKFALIFWPLSKDPTTLARFYLLPAWGCLDQRCKKQRVSGPTCQNVTGSALPTFSWQDSSNGFETHTSDWKKGIKQRALSCVEKSEVRRALSVTLFKSINFQLPFLS